MKQRKSKSIIPLHDRNTYWCVLKECAAMFGMKKKDINERVKELKPLLFNDDLFYHNEPLYWAASWAGVNNPDDYHPQYQAIQKKYYD
jgi:hypothetical protein